MSNILLVEDDYLDIINVERAFRKANIHHKLIVARNGKEALSLLHGLDREKITPKPSLILLDINMPKMNGFEFLEEIRTDPGFRSIPVFIMTTSEEEADRQQALRYNVLGYIIKPLSFDDLGTRVSSLDSFNLLCDLLKI
jgi:CheY-like chemotaxis protein